MLRITTMILLAIGLLFMIAASGCSESEDAIVSPGHGDNSMPCGGYEPGVVVVGFDTDVSLADIDVVARSFGFGYKYISKGQFRIVADVVEGDAVALHERVSASPLVDHVCLAHRSYPKNVSFLVMQFAVGIGLGDAQAFVASYPELELTRFRRDPVEAHFEVPIGDEDEWIDYFLQEELVIYSNKAWIACPAVE